MATLKLVTDDYDLDDAGPPAELMPPKGVRVAYGTEPRGNGFDVIRITWMHVPRYENLIRQRDVIAWFPSENLAEALVHDLQSRGRIHATPDLSEL